MEDEFQELETFSQNNKSCSILEAGCGVGTALPLIKKHASINFSPRTSVKGYSIVAF